MGCLVEMVGRQALRRWLPTHIGVLVCSVWLLGVGLLHAGTPEEEYRQYIQVPQTLQPLGKYPFGEQINLYDGSLSFQVTDIDLRGTGLPLQLVRSYKVENSSADGYQQNTLLAGWTLEVPRLTTLVARRSANLAGPGWVVNSTDQLARCSQFFEPPDMVPTDGSDWSPDEWWTGVQMLVPGHGSQVVLARSPQNGQMPQMNGMSFPLTTSKGWQISCLSSTDNGEPGEAFLAIAPDGTRYTFNHLVYLPADPATRLWSVGINTTTSTQTMTAQPMLQANGGTTLLRNEADMLVTLVQDRFGNTLTYHYNGANLTSITAGDGRQVTLQYNADGTEVQTATAVAAHGTSRTWTYAMGALGTTDPSKVILPDGSAWVYVTNSHVLEHVTGSTSCDAIGTVQSGGWNATFTHPSGLTATFQMTAAIRGRSYVPRSCLESPTDASLSYAELPRVYYQFELQSVAYAGAGLPSNETWNYSYSAPNASWTSDSCASTQSCPGTVYTDVVDPDGNVTRSTFSNRFDASEGQLLRTDTYAGAVASGAPLRSDVHSYASATGGPWPVNYGWDYSGRTNVSATTEVAPLSMRTTTQDGQTYTWQAMAFNTYAQPTDVKRYNDVAGQTPIEETTAYLNDPAFWVLGLPQTVTNVGTGEVEASNTYNSLDELASRARFGETLMTYTWNTAGQLASFTDGNSHTTTLGNYYRGIPQSIGYPDGTSETLTVDDLGQVTSVTDQAGHTTGYSYDPIGRVAQITYPYDSSIDSVQWSPKVFSYAYVTSAERGVAAGHWRRTTSQGSATDTTYFDANLRPVLDDTANGSMDISTATGYDWRGLTTFASYPTAGSPALPALTAGTRRAYDALGRLIQAQQDSELGALTTTTAYLPGARTRVTDPKGNVTTTAYQVFDEPDDRAPIQVQAPAGITQTIVRNVYGNPLSITQSGTYGTETDSVTKTLVYDGYHRLCRTTEPETGSTVMAYDAANNLAWSAEGQAITEGGCGQDQVAAAARTVRTYDAMNRVLTIAPPSGTQSTVYTYDALGHVHTTVSGVATQGFAYNSLGALTSESLQVAGSGSTWTLGYGYDAYGHRATVSYPAGMGTSESVGYAPDAWGRPTQVGSYVTGVGYFPNGQVQGFTYGNGRSYLAEQNTRQLVSNFTDGAGSVLDLSEDLAYDANGNITTVNDLAGGLRNKSFGYDALNRLVSASAPNLYGTKSYSYDPLNNLRTWLTQGQTLTYHYDATNKLASITQGTTSLDNFTYNAQGDTIGQNSATLAFDAKHQLTSLPGVESYSYDAAGRRVMKQPAAGSPTYYFYDQAGQLMVRYAPGAATTTNFIYLGTRLVAQHDHVQLSQPGAIGFGANPTAGSTTVSWGGTLAATSYVLQQSSDGGSTWSTVYGGSATGTTVSGLAGGGYVYRVQACIGSNCGGWTTSATLGVWPAIPAVSVPAGTINGPYTVSWTVMAGATSYTVQESLNGGAWGAIATNTAATSISRPGTTTGSYTYRVEASDAYGTAGWSATSAAVSVNTAYGVVPTPAPTLGVPATSSTGSATVSWTASSPVTGYTLQQSGNGGGTWTTVYSGTATSAALSGLANGSYTYQVQACNTTAGDTACTAWVAGGTLVVTLPPTSAPSLATPASNGTGSYAVSWSAVATATSYTLQVSSNGGGSWSTAYSGGTTGWAASGQGNGSYAYRVQACNVGGCGAWSSTGTTTVLLPPASAPGLSVPAGSATGSYTVSWGGVATATSYTLQLGIDGGGWGTVYSGGATSWAASGQATGTYAYRVQACNASGCGPWSSTGTINVLLPPGSAPSLSVPGSSNTGSYTVSWGAVATASGYTLQESVNGGGWSTVQSGSATNWAASGHATGTYAYQVQACNASGCGPWSGSASTSVLLVPATPTGLSSTLYVTYDPTLRPPTRYSLAASWPAVVGAANYTFKNCQPNGVCSTTTTAATSIPPFPVGGATVSVSLQACNAVGCSAWSAPQAPTTVNQ